MGVMCAMSSYIYISIFSKLHENLLLSLTI